MSNDYSPPVMETTTDKHDALDWKNLPIEKCDLNYRPMTARPPLIQLRTLGFAAVVPLVSLPIVIVIQAFSGTAFATMSGFVFSLLVGALLALAFHQLEFSPRQMVLGFVGPMLLWLLIIATPFHRYSSASILILICFALPAAFWFADLVATHAIHWMSAHYKNDHATMFAWRADWEQRFHGITNRPPRRPDLSPKEKDLHDGIQATRSAYRNGVFWLVLLVMLPGVAVLSSLSGESRFTTGFSVVFVLFVALIIGCIVRNFQFPGSLQRTWFYFCDWIWHGAFLRQPPWVFQSPGGSALQRQLGMIFALFVITLTLLPLSDYFRWLYFGAFNAEVLPEHLIQNPDPFSLWWAAFQGNFYVGFLTLLHYLLLFGAPGLFLFLATHFIAGPVISAHYLALEGAHAYEQHPDWDRLDGYSERLRKSRNEKERNSIIKARQLTNDYPVLIHTKLLFEHVHMLGATGIGKTVLGLMTDMIQLIRRNDGPVVIVDCKGDSALFNTAREEANRLGRKFRWFTNSLNRSTYIFNPFSKSMYAQLSLQEIVGLLMSALNMHHGSDYGRAWFTIASQILMKRAFEETVAPDGKNGHASRGPKHPKFGKIESFQDLNDIILFLAADGKEFQAAQHLSFLIESLAGFEQLNLSPKNHANRTACENAINMDDVVDNNEVVYFYLEGAVDSITVSEIGRLAIYCLLTACINYRSRTGHKTRAYLFVDEAQAVIGQNITHVLAQARSFGLACFLANQTMSQLNPSGGTDLRELVMGCTSVKQVFSARDPWLMKYVSEMSGKVRYANFSYQQDARDLIAGLFGLPYVVKNEFGVPVVEMSNSIGDRLGTQDILDFNRDPNMCALAIERAEGFSRWIGFAPVFVDWPMSERTYDERDDPSKWPEGTPETITLKSPWPEPNSEVIVPKNPVLVIEDFTKDVSDRLDKLKRDLDDES